MLALVLVVALALVFDLTNGFHDSANAVAALVATRAARPPAALLLASACTIAGPLLVGTAVADTVGSVVALSAGEVVPAVGAAVTAAIAWNLLTWRGTSTASRAGLPGGCGLNIAHEAVDRHVRRGEPGDRTRLESGVPDPCWRMSGACVLPAR